MFHIGEFARAARVSVRMVHHYDAIGLLCPARVDSTGYRLYEELRAAGVTPTGPGVAYYEALDGGRVRVHAGAQVAAGVGNGASFEVVELPAVGQAATLIHRGPMGADSGQWITELQEPVARQA